MSADQIHRTREQLYAVLAQGDLSKAIELTRWLELRDEPQRAQWAHRLGDLYRRQGDLQSAALAYERASRAYAEAGFERRAAAMLQTWRSTWPPRTA